MYSRINLESKIILINPKLLVVNYDKNNNFFKKIIGYNRYNNYSDYNSYNSNNKINKLL
jgi:hypothetical protein